MSKKSERNQDLQQGKAERGYGGYLPSVARGGGRLALPVDPEPAVQEDDKERQRPEPWETKDVRDPDRGGR
ncbi:hypothetical protein [Caldinitratiruptor microaerophilus]|uniref:Uncharacterized protein n=1 Tax=Caldinitratiruptor microaerophilus TaxID=671077 RepID=A0AA35CNI3_9FIRM|nr:hypothetical protein [Caldinitratiruptor microaerophilus]BDG62447.1 hypothetical protein caldi_35370 [Caldinitratiruptor microaerophilus]